MSAKSARSTRPAPLKTLTVKASIFKRHRQQFNGRQFYNVICSAHGDELDPAFKPFGEDKNLFSIGVSLAQLNDMVIATNRPMYMTFEVYVAKSGAHYCRPTRETIALLLSESDQLKAAALCAEDAVECEANNVDDEPDIEGNLDELDDTI